MLVRAHDARFDDELYHRRSIVETAFRVIKQRYSDRLHSRSWYHKFREFTLKCAVKTSITASEPLPHD